MSKPTKSSDDEYLIVKKERIVSFELLCPRDNWAGLCPLIHEEILERIYGKGFLAEAFEKLNIQPSTFLSQAIPSIFLVYKKLESLSLPAHQSVIKKEILSLCEKALLLLNIPEDLQTKSVPVFKEATDKYAIGYGHPVEHIKAMTREYLKILPTIASYASIIKKIDQRLIDLNIDLSQSVVLSDKLNSEAAQSRSSLEFIKKYTIEKSLGLDKLAPHIEFLEIVDDNYFLDSLITPHSAQTQHTQAQILDKLLLPWSILVGLKNAQLSNPGSPESVYFVCPTTNALNANGLGESIDKATRFYSHSDCEAFISKNPHISKYRHLFARVDFVGDEFIGIESMASNHTPPPPIIMEQFISSLIATNEKNKMEKLIPDNSPSSPALPGAKLIKI